ncbi:MAG: hypothetical protein Kow00108_16580 [Calditrichia bacterium]
MKKLDFYKILLILLIVNGLIRCTHLWWGFPAIYISTEYWLSKHVMSMIHSKTVIPVEPIYPTLYYFLLVLIYGINFIVGAVTNVYQSKYAFVAQYLIHPESVLLYSRAVSWVLFLMLQVIWYRFIREWINKTAALGAVAMIAFSGSLFLFSFIQVQDMLLLVLTSLAIFAMLNSVRYVSVRYLFMAAFWSGLAVSTKYNAGFLGLSLLMTGIVLLKLYREQVAIRQMVLAMVILFVSFLLGTPGWLLAPEHFLTGFRNLVAQNYTIINPEYHVPLLWPILEMIKENTGIGILWLLGLFTLFKSDRITRCQKAIFLALFIPTYIVVGFFSKQGFDYLFPVLPIFLIGGSLWIGQAVNSERKWIGVMLYLLLALSFIQSSFLSFRFHQKDTRQQLSEWLMAQKPSIDAICYNHYHQDLQLFDLERFMERGKTAARLPEEVKQHLQQFTTDPRNIRMISLFYQPYVNPYGIPIDTLMKAMQIRDLMTLDSMGVDLIILHEEELEIYRHYNSIHSDNPFLMENMKKKGEVYSQLLRTDPIVTFSPKWYQGGPALRVYDIKQVLERNNLK